MDHCPRCGGEVHAGDAFCRTCGATVGGGAAATSGQPWPLAGAGAGAGAVPVAEDAVWPDGSPALEQFQPLEGKARAAKVALGASGVLALLTAPVNLQPATAIEEFLSTGNPSVFDDSDNLLAILAIPSAIVGITTIVLFLVWFSRAYKNLPALGIRRLRFTAGWAVGAWFVPFLNLVRPKTITNDLWRTSDPDLPPEPTAAWRDRPVSGIVHWWGAIYLFSIISVTFDIGDGQIDQRDATFARLDAFRNVLSFVAALLAIRVVGGITERQRQRAERAGAA